MPGRVLIVAPHFAPINAPDGHRVRLILPWLRELGWQATVLTVRPECATAPLESELELTIPADTMVQRVNAISPKRGRRIGVGNLGWRCLPWLWREGSRLLRDGGFDVVYFSTTQFACVPLGRWWRQRFGTPYVIDLQDPWYNVYYEQRHARPPGGWKHRFAALSTRMQEGWTLRRCSHVVAVSPRYVQDLKVRRPWFNTARTTVLPFGWSERDQQAARSRRVPPIDQPAISYIGRVGEDMVKLLRVVFAAYSGWRRLRSTGTRAIRWIFTGTSYAANAAGHGTAARVAAEFGLADLVSEDRARVSYLDSLARQQASPANLILGSDDLGYFPSKVWPLLASGRPWLACAWQRSVLSESLKPHAASGVLLTIDPERVARDQETLLFDWFDRVASGAATPPVSCPTLREFHADRMARAHAEIFDAVTS